MSYQELYPIVVSEVAWGSLWERKQIRVYSEHEGTVKILQKSRRSCPEINKAMHLLAILSTLHNFVLTAL